MSHSSAFYHDQPQIVTAYLSDGENHPAAPPTAHIPAETQLASPQHSAAIQDAAADIPSSERTSVHTFTSRQYPSDPWDPSYPQSGRHSRQQSVKPVSPTAAPVTLVSSPYLGENHILSPPNNGAARKEDHTRRSWTDHSSYMSGDNRNPGVARAQKRAVQDSEFVSNDGQDAVLMLVS